MNKLELEQKIGSLQKELNDAIGAIRELSMQNTKNLELISRLNSDVADLKMEYKKLETSLNASTQKYDNSVNRYR